MCHAAVVNAVVFPAADVDVDAGAEFAHGDGEGMEFAADEGEAFGHVECFAVDGDGEEVVGFGHGLGDDECFEVIVCASQQGDVGRVAAGCHCAVVEVDGGLAGQSVQLHLDVGCFQFFFGESVAGDNLYGGAAQKVAHSDVDGIGCGFHVVCLAPQEVAGLVGCLGALVGFCFEEPVGGIVWRAVVGVIGVEVGGGSFVLPVDRGGRCPLSVVGEGDVIGMVTRGEQGAWCRAFVIDDVEADAVACFETGICGSAGGGDAAAQGDGQPVWLWLFFVAVGRASGGQRGQQQCPGQCVNGLHRMNVFYLLCKLW